MSNDRARVHNRVTEILKATADAWTVREVIG